MTITDLHHLGPVHEGHAIEGQGIYIGRTVVKDNAYYVFAAPEDLPVVDLESRYDMSPVELLYHRLAIKLHGTNNLSCILDVKADLEAVKEWHGYYSAGIIDAKQLNKALAHPDSARGIVGKWVLATADMLQRMYHLRDKPGFTQNGVSTLRTKVPAGAKTLNAICYLSSDSGRWFFKKPIVVAFNYGGERFTGNRSIHSVRPVRYVSVNTLNPAPS
ncbi:MAG: hypothetical protein EB059_08330 [Alphaproteobacteria bacterium]|nr:hypothetical protein [Alphaproteobacteria bacterium]